MRNPMILFHHVHKCAGTTFESYLQQMFPSSTIYLVDAMDQEGSLRRFVEFNDEQVMQYELVMGHRAHELMDRLFSVRPDVVGCCLLRNPVHRVFSYYEYEKGRGNIPEHVTLERILEKGIIGGGRNTVCSDLIGQTEDWVLENEGEAFERACEELSKYEFVKDVSQLERLLKELSLKTGRLRGLVPDGRRLNVGEGVNGKVKDEKLVKLVEEMNWVDIKLWETFCPGPHEKYKFGRVDVPSRMKGGTILNYDFKWTLDENRFFQFNPDRHMDFYEKVTRGVFKDGKPKQELPEVPEKKTYVMEDTVVVTATDHNYLIGAYMLAWTLFQFNRVRMRVYDFGIKPCRMKDEMEEWGVEFEKADLLFPKKYEKWQQYNKPVVIRDAMMREEEKYVLWLDADVLVGGTLEEVSERMKKMIFVPDHGELIVWVESQRNDPEIHEYLGQPKTRWGGVKWPCAGICGFNSERDRGLLDEWVRRVVKLSKRPDLLPKVGYGDQGVFQDILDLKREELVKGTYFNAWIRCHREVTPYDLLEYAFNQVCVFAHITGVTKPFATWRKPLYLPTPREGMSFSSGDYGDADRKT